MKRKILALALALLLCAAMAVSASADAIILPEEVSYDITSAHLEDGSCYALNVFLSNFVEIGLAQYDQNTPDSEMMAAILKHLEINAKFFSGDVTQVSGEDGKTYMRVSESIFNTRMQKLFGRSIPASACPGYEGGSILVSAAHFGGPIQVFASVYNCTKESDGVYRAYFDAYLVNQDFSGWHRTANRNLPAEKLTLLGKGEALVSYNGYDTVSSISTSDFSLVQWSMDAQGIPCVGANLPYGVEETEPPTEAPTEVPTEAPTQVSTEAPDPVPAEVVTTPELSDKSFDEPAQLSTGVLILIIVLVIVVALLSLAVVLLLRKKK